MTGIGTMVNVAAIAAGGLAGLAFGRVLPAPVRMVFTFMAFIGIWQFIRVSSVPASRSLIVSYAVIIIQIITFYNI